uniref:Uncharacterized protein n=1 Tax=Siphoviridae sp. ctWhx86 TaxID=2826362 RepID=A0A8S5QPZ3_9CAUD|nr:MAG TPA: hypothetical protein [Siphoviridae sp. ctWhx86]
MTTIFPNPRHFLSWVRVSKASLSNEKIPLIRLRRPCQRNIL